jgi:hypothetical protein
MTTRKMRVPRFCEPAAIGLPYSFLLMFCPGCGSEERQASQFCRACGTDLRAVRVTLERPDSITASAATAREEIGRAFADRIREVEDARDMKRVAEDVLPQIEKFLESPEEKRLRRMRVGVIISSIGLGATIMMILIGSIARRQTWKGSWPVPVASTSCSLSVSVSF